MIRLFHKKLSCLKLLLTPLLVFTINFGHTQLIWQQLTTGTNKHLYDSYFVGTNIGWAVGADGTIIRTIDGGTNWTNLTSGVSAYLFGIHFINSLKGWAVGGGGTVIKTLDGGNNWSPYTFPNSTTFKDIHFVNDTLGWIAGATSASNSVIYKTTDGGASWNEVGNVLPDGIQSIDFFNLNYGMATTTFNAYVTIDGGDTWVQMPLPTTFQLGRVELYNASTAWISCANGTVLKTISGGSPWTVQSVPTSSILWDIATVNGTDLFAVGYGGSLVTSTNGGSSWDFNSSLSATDSIYSIFAVNPTTNYVTAENGIMYKSSAEYDLSISGYLGANIVCPNQNFQVSVQLKSNGPSPATEANIIVLQGTQPALTYNWTGNLSAGAVETVNLGNMSIVNDQILTITIVGDNVNSNNTFYQPIAVYDEVAAGTNDLINACVGDNIELEAYGGVSYHWFNASSDTTNAYQNVVANHSTTYYVNIKQTQCTVFDSVLVVIDTDCNTNAFSPNDDAVNDYFIIDGLSGPSRVIIYNRWGDEIIILENYDNINVAWDGTDGHGKNVTEGTYYYLVDEGSSNSNAGWVQVIR